MAACAALAVSVSKRDTITSGLIAPNFAASKARHSSGTVMLERRHTVRDRRHGGCRRSGQRRQHIDRQRHGRHSTSQRRQRHLPARRDRRPRTRRCQRLYGQGVGVRSGGNTSQYIDLTHITFNGNVHRSYSGTTTGGVLTVTSGATVVAKINMVGNYTTSSFKLGADRAATSRSPTRQAARRTRQAPAR
jgi:hypothetical protein